MKPKMYEENSKDELVRIEAENLELIEKGFKNGKLTLPKNVVLLSKAKKVMDEFVTEVTEYGGMTPPIEVRGEEKSVFAEWAEREMDKYSYKKSQKFKRPVNG